MANRSRWFNFRLRTLLIAILIGSLPIGYVSHRLLKYRQQKRILEDILTTCSVVEIAYRSKSIGRHQIQPMPAWSQCILGDDLFKSVDRIVLGGGTSVWDLSSLAELTYLPSLHLWDTPSLSDLSPLTGLTELKYLNIYNTSVADFSPLAGLTELEELRVGSTPVSDLSPLAGLTQLKSLWLQGTTVSDLTPLRKLTQLQTLYLQGSSVSDLLPLSELSQLRDLRLENTSVSDLSPLTGLPLLEELNLRGTSISDKRIAAFKESRRKRGLKPVKISRQP